MPAPLTITGTGRTAGELRRFAGRCRDHRRRRCARAIASGPGGCLPERSRRGCARRPGPSGTGRFVTAGMASRGWPTARGRAAPGVSTGTGAPFPRSGPGPAPAPGTAGARWRLKDLAARARARSGVSASVSAMWRTAPGPGFSHRTVRPLHPRAGPGRQSGFRNGSGGRRLRARADRDPVPGRAGGGPEGHGHAHMGAPGRPAPRGARPPLRIPPPLRRQPRRGSPRRRPRLREGEHRRDGRPPGDGPGEGEARQPRGGRARRSRLAQVQGSRGSRQRVPAAPAAVLPGTGPGRAGLRPPAPGLPLQPSLPDGRGRSGLDARRLERVRGRPGAHRVDHQTVMGPRLLKQPVKWRSIGQNFREMV